MTLVCQPPKCAEYQIQVVPRPGAVCAEPVACTLATSGSTWSWTRQYGIPSVASFSTRNLEGCCDCVPRAWESELEFWRDGIRVWVGPVTDVMENKTENVLSILAADRSIWPYQEQKVLLEEVGETTESPEERFVRLFRILDKPESGLKLRQFGQTGLTIKAPIALYGDGQLETATLAEYGVGWTVVDDELRFGSLWEIEEPVPIIPGQHWENNGALVSDVGTAYATAVVVRTETYSVVFPDPPTPDRCKGQHIRVVEPEFELTETEALIYARSRWETARKQGLQVLTSIDSSVTSEWPSSVCEMTPGQTYVVDTRTPDFCLQTSSEATLKSLVVEGADTKETNVKPELGPIDAVAVEV